MIHSREHNSPHVKMSVLVLERRSKQIHEYNVVWRLTGIGDLVVHVHPVATSRLQT